LPLLIEKGGDAYAKVMQAMFSSVAAGVGAIDSLNVVDMGGSGAGVARIADLVPNIVARTVANAKAQGIDLKGLLTIAGGHASKLDELLGQLFAPPGSGNGQSGAVPPTPPSVVLDTAPPT